jgi:hypothetical protein
MIVLRWLKWFQIYPKIAAIVHYYDSFRRSLEPFHLSLNSTRLNQRLLKSQMQKEN